MRTPPDAAGAPRRPRPAPRRPRPGPRRPTPRVSALGRWLRARRRARAAPGPPRTPRRSPPVRRHPERRPLRRLLVAVQGLFLRPNALAVAIVVVAICLVTGFAGAVLWANSDSQYIRRDAPVAPPPDRRPIEEALAEGETTTTTKPDLSPEALAAKLGPSVWSVETLNSAGQPVGGSAFLAGSSGDQGLLLTSLAAVEASTREPGPEITVKGATFTGKATVWTWDEGRDLALLVVQRGTAPVPEWVGDNPPLKEGDKLFAVGGGGRVTSGTVLRLAPDNVEHDIVVDDALRGGPLVNVKGEVVGVASAVYTAGGVPLQTVYAGVPIRTACAAVLKCGDTAPPTTARATSTTRGRGATTTRP
ncbi:MAG TPA: trypsin-like peptidase domain-containing protein [Acidimicrobiales bacterium]|nr:trypsin-like peptidase domain-containing protein [Acidimicrobiales bacterium]